MPHDRRRAGFLPALLIAASPGAAGAAKLPVVIENRAGAALECHAVAGHWYGFDLGTIAVGGTQRVVFGLDRASGTISLRNALNQPLPIQYVYCGAAGDAWRTRADLPLRRLAQGERAATFICRTRGAALTCD